MEDTLQTWGRPQSSSSRSGDMSGLLFVGGLPLHACDQNLTRYFRRFGPLDSAEVQRRSSGRSKGYAFIQFVRPADALKVFLKQHSILGKAVVVSLSRRSIADVPKTEWNPRSTRRVLVCNLPPYFRELDLLRRLSKHVQVENVSLLKPQPGTTKQYCYVVTKTVTSSQYLLDMQKIVIEDGSDLEIRPAWTKISDLSGNRAQVPSARDRKPQSSSYLCKSPVALQASSIQESKSRMCTKSSLESDRLEGPTVINIRKGLSISGVPLGMNVQTSQSNYGFRLATMQMHAQHR